jgi:hypothetical protein
MTTTNTSFPFPHAQLTPIPGKPTAATIRQLKKEIYANARSVHSDRGGGLNGHLGLVMPTAAYVLRAGDAFNEPNHPGPQPVHAAAATNAQITAANRTYDQDISEFKTYSAIKEKLKQQVLSAVDPIYYQNLEDETFGYADVAIPTIITHLTRTYGTLTASDLELNRDKLTEAWNPDDPIENLWLNIKITRAVATQGGEPISDGTTIQLSLIALGKTGVHSHAIETWFDKDEADHTWPNFQLHFNKHEKTRLTKMTAQAAGFHGAQNATRIPNQAAQNATRIPDDQAIAANAQQTGKHKDTFVSNGIPLYYCWSHGLSKSSDHTSRTCNTQSEGHCLDATIDNRLGGVNKINFGRSGKQRRVPG